MVILGIAIFAAVATPGGDLVSPFVLGGTMYVLFELTVMFIRRCGTMTDPRPTVRPRRPTRDRPEPAVVILSGLSGGGKTAAAKLFEDLGYTVVDNLPGELLPDLAELVSTIGKRFAQVAIVLDVRAGDAETGPRRHARRARGPRHPAPGRLPRSPRRRPHPALQRDPPSPPARGRTRDRRLDRAGAAAPRPGPRSEADVVVDTSDLSLRQLRERLFAQLATTVRPDQLAIQLISFGYKYGVPLEADLVFDVRFMQNPFYVPELRPLSG